MIYQAIKAKDLVLFPNTISPIFLSTKESIDVATFAFENNLDLCIVFENGEIVSKIGILSKISQFSKMPDNVLKLVLDIHSRCELTSVVNEVNETFSTVDANICNVEKIEITTEIKALTRVILKTLELYSDMMKNISMEFVRNLINFSDPNTFADIVSSYIHLDFEKKIILLETLNIAERLKFLLLAIEEENDILMIEKKIHKTVKKQIDKSQREYYINEQIKALKSELGDSDSATDLVKIYEDKIKNKHFPDYVLSKVKDELKKLKSQHYHQSETSIRQSYLDLIFNLPWNEKSEIENDIEKIENYLETSHYGLEKIKQRILEEVSVLLRNGGNKKTIICLYGAPGVGKTSLVKTIAESMNRKYIKISLGGIHDEAEIRGHRKTYIGAMPGKIINAMEKAKVINPVILLDEIDKISIGNGRGDCVSAMLEVLDPEQNKNFNDHYLDLDYDLSNVLFIATANTLDMPRPLLDRMEIINIPSYLLEEKIHIADKYIIPKALKAAGFKDLSIKIDQECIKSIIRFYTKESGVRELTRQIEKIVRKVSFDILKSKKSSKKLTINLKNLEKYLGGERFIGKDVKKEKIVGSVNGLAYTEVGGCILPIEAVKVANGKGELKFTGKLGETMRESIQTAYSFICSNAEKFNLKIEEIKQLDIHLHVPDGATPKDGPSAGTAITTCLLSLLSNEPIEDIVAMTGEISLLGNVLPIGGLREKLTAAVRAGVKNVFIPEENKKDLEEVPSYILKKLTINHVSSFNQIYNSLFKN